MYATKVLLETSHRRQKQPTFNNEDDSPWTEEQAEEWSESDFIPSPVNLQENKNLCIICMEKTKIVPVDPCGHKYCKPCILTAIKDSTTCPTCRQDIVAVDKIKNIKSRRRRADTSQDFALAQSLSIL